MAHQKSKMSIIILLLSSISFAGYSQNDSIGITGLKNIYHNDDKIEFEIINHFKKPIYLIFIGLYIYSKSSDEWLVQVPDLLCYNCGFKTGSMVVCLNSNCIKKINWDPKLEKTRFYYRKIEGTFRVTFSLRFDPEYEPKKIDSPKFMILPKR